MMTPGLRNILVLSVSFLLIFTGFHTIALLQDVDGGVSSPPNSLAIIYVVFGITCSSAPCLLSLLGHRCCLVLGGSLYTVYCSQLFFPSLALQYSCSVLLGAGAAILWTAQGHMLAASSNCDTVSRNCGVFWSIFQIAPALAALLVWALWGGEEESGTLASALLGLTLTGCSSFLLLSFPNNRVTGPEWREALLRPVKVCHQVDEDLSRSFKVCRKTSLLALAPACLVIGLHHVVMEAQEQEAASILLTGCKKTLGQVLAGLLTWWLGGLGGEGSRGLTITGGCFCVLGLGVLLLPQLGPLVATKPGSEILLAAVPALLGLGDGLINVQLTCRLALADLDSAAAHFALYKLLQSAGSCLGYLATPHLGLVTQLVFLSFLLPLSIIILIAAPAHVTDQQ